MTRADADAECRRLAAEHRDRATHQWFPKDDGNGSWVVVKVQAPPGTRIDPLTATTEAKPKPPQADDPRSAFEQNVGGPYYG